MILKINWQNEPLILLRRGSGSSPVAAIVLYKIKVNIFFWLNQM